MQEIAYLIIIYFMGSVKRTGKGAVCEKQKKNRLDFIQTAHLMNSGIGIRTPTYRVRVCCATFTQYRYLYDLR